MDKRTRREPKRLFIETYGCQMNAYDSERMRDVLAPLGYAIVDKPDDADLVILNTCHIREKATDKVYSEIGRLRAHKERRAAETTTTTDSQRTVALLPKPFGEVKADVGHRGVPTTVMAFDARASRRRS